MLPFCCLYILSGIMYPVVYYLIGYRKKVVFANLKNAFPEKSQAEIQNTARRFYRHICDITLEIIRMQYLKKEDYLKRMIFTNPELVNRYIDEGKSVMILTMHYNNWEWSSCFPHYLNHHILGVYKPLHNRLFDVYLNEAREKQGAEMISNAQVLRRIIRAEKSGERVLLWLAGDQTPPEFHKFWMLFMGQEAMFYPGPASLSRRFNLPVFFQHTEKTARGYYKTTFELLSEHPEELSEAEIMKKYVGRMEQIIRWKPEFYLWSHKRWKHKRPDNLPLINISN